MSETTEPTALEVLNSKLAEACKLFAKPWDGDVHYGREAIAVALPALRQFAQEQGVEAPLLNPFNSVMEALADADAGTPSILFRPREVKGAPPKHHQFTLRRALAAATASLLIEAARQRGEKLSLRAALATVARKMPDQTASQIGNFRGELIGERAPGYACTYYKELIQEDGPDNPEQTAAGLLHALETISKNIVKSGGLLQEPR